jgi:hypothetical protein
MIQRTRGKTTREDEKRERFTRKVTLMQLWRYTLLACLLVSGCSFNPSANPATTNDQAPTVKAGAATATAIDPVPTAKVEQQLQNLWYRLDKGAPPTNKLPIAWKPAYSVLFPREWPPTPTTTWVRYAYAQGMDMDLHDGVRVASPWARLELRGNSTTVTIVPLYAKLEPVTTQGITPIDAATQAVLAKEGDVSAYCLQLTALPNSAEVAQIRAFYQTWLKYNGALVDLIRADHTKFLAWVND